MPIALARLRAEGAVVTTSESWMYECMGDAGIQEYVTYNSSLEAQVGLRLSCRWKL